MTFLLYLLAYVPSAICPTPSFCFDLLVHVENTSSGRGCVLHLGTTFSAFKGNLLRRRFATFESPKAVPFWRHLDTNLMRYLK